MYYHFARWRAIGLWRKLNKQLRRKLRKRLGRNEEPSAGCADSQSVKAGSFHGNGFDGAKSVNGRKRHLLVDTLGLVLSVLVSSADIPERKGLSRLLNQSRPHLPRLHHLWLDRGYKGINFTNRILLCFGVVLEIVAGRSEKSFRLQARRWVVEMTHSQCCRTYLVLASHAASFISFTDSTRSLKGLKAFLVAANATTAYGCSLRLAGLDVV